MNNKVITIRKAQQKDINGIASLFSHHISRQVLTWALSERAKDKSFNSFVAVDSEDSIVGHIAYTNSNYRYNDTKTEGVFPIMWIVSPDLKGGIGLMLLQKAISTGSYYSVVIGGSEVARKILPSLKYNLKFQVPILLKVLKPIKYFSKTDRSSIKKIVKGMFFTSTFINDLYKKSIYRPNTRHLYLEEYSKNRLSSNGKPSNVVFNDINEYYINWLLSCPSVESHACSIKYRESYIGFFICYIDRTDRDFSKAGIIHLSFLGNEIEMWRNVLLLIDRFLLEKKCSYVSTMASHPIFIQALKDNGYITWPNFAIPFFLRDTNDLFKAARNDEWHLTYAEGDLGYRKL